MKKKRVASGGYDLEEAVFRLQGKMARVTRFGTRLTWLENRAGTARDFEKMILARIQELDDKFRRGSE